MRHLKEWLRRLLWLARRSRFQAEIDEEMRFHIESRAEEIEAGGVERAEALRRARREFGSAVRVAEDSGQAWRLQWIEDLFSDLGYAARAFRRNPGFAATAVLCLGLGTGANLAIFHIATSFLLSEPSCRDAASLIAIREGGNSHATMTDYRYLRRAHIFDGMAGINVEREVNWREGDTTRRFYAGIVTDDTFSTLGVPFLLGRGIAPEETNTAVLSARIWRGELGGDAGILGRKVVLDGRVYTVVGVLPPNHRSAVGLGLAPDVYLPASRDDDIVQVFARMPKGMTIPVARARLMGVLDDLDRVQPVEDWKRASRNTRVYGVAGFDAGNPDIGGPMAAFFVMLVVVVSLVLLIACTNVASMLLARAASRSHELAIRVSLGAGRRRIVRHLLAESLLLAGMGSLAGIAIDAGCARVIGSVSFPVPLPIHLVLTPDWRLLWYALGLVAASTLLCGLLPAVRAVRGDVNVGLKQEERQTERTFSLRGALVAGQISVSVVLLVTGFLFLHNLARATSMDPGFDVHHTIWASMRLVPGGYEAEGRAVFVREALERLRALPGVEAAAIARHVPLNDNCVQSQRVQPDLPRPPVQVHFECNSVGPDYFRAIRIPILGGREFTAADRNGSQPVVIVNESFARMVFGNANPVGHTIRYVRADSKTRRIVGVAKDSKYFVMGERQMPAVYEPYFAWEEPGNLHLLIRVAGAPEGYVKTINRVLERMDETAAIETKPMNRALGLALLPSQAGAVTLGAMGLLGLVLAAIGLYGVLLYSVSRRTREIGLRVALGARPADVLRMVLRQSAALVGSGVLVGLVLAYFAVQPLALFLVPGMSPVDLPAFAVVMGVLGAVALVATMVPVSRALRVDPMAALRCD